MPPQENDQTPAQNTESNQTQQAQPVPENVEEMPNVVPPQPLDPATLEQAVEASKPANQNPYDPTAEFAEPSPQVKAAQEAGKKVSKKSRVLTIFIIIAVTLVGGTFALLYTLQQNAPEPQQQTEEVPEDTEEETQEPTPEDTITTQGDFTTYQNSEFEFALVYPNTATFTPETNPAANPLVYTVSSFGPNQPGPVENDRDLLDGYITKLYLHKNIISRDLNQIALTKRASYTALCPPTLEIGSIINTELSGVPATQFEILNCDVNFVETFAIRDNELYEIVQIYRGDIGVRQQYKNGSTTIRDMFKFTNVVTPTPLEQWVQKDVQSFSFKHPNDWDLTCCNMAGPMSERAVKQIVFVEPESLIPGQNSFNGIAVYFENLQTGGFDAYVENQKQLLVESYRLVIGRDPITEMIPFSANGANGWFLKGYAWWGDLYIVKHPTRDIAITIVKSETVNGEMDEFFGRFIETFEYKE